MQGYVPLLQWDYGAEDEDVKLISCSFEKEKSAGSAVGKLSGNVSGTANLAEAEKVAEANMKAFLEELELEEAEGKKKGKASKKTAAKGRKK